MRAARTPFLLCAALLLHAAATFAQSAASAITVPKAHPILGVWQSSVQVAAAGGKSATRACPETLDYRASNIRLGTSGKEITRATFTIGNTATKTGFYRLTETVLASNGKPDCAGDVHEAKDDTEVRFIQFSPKRDQFIVCRAESLAECFGPFARQP